MESKALKKARVMTRPKSNTLDPQGVVVKSNLERSLGIKYLKKVSIGRYIEVELGEGPEEDVKKNIQEAIDKLLYNEIIEDYEVIYE
jgi:phosphoribosylformylglycinamidine synthase PurS subunit